MAIGPDQDVVAVGRIAGLPTIIAVVKYDGDSGERVWCESFPLQALSTTGAVFPVPFAEVGGVAIDASGTIVIGGHGRPAPAVLPYPQRPGMPVAAADRYFATRCSSGGGCSSIVTFIDPAVTGSHNDRLGGIAIGPDDHPVLTGLAESPSTSGKRPTFTLLTVKVDGATFAPLATAQAWSNPPAAASTQDVAIDSSNSIFVTGSDGSTLKYNSILGSTPVWTRALAGAKIASGHPGGGQQLVVLQSVGSSAGTGGVGVTTLDAETGATLWSHTYGTGLNDTPRDVATDHHGNILIAADYRSRDGGPAGRLPRGQVVSLTAEGDVNWAVPFPTGHAGAASSVAAIAVGLDGDPVVTGHSAGELDAPAVVMNTVKYGVDTLAVAQRFDAAEHPVHDNRLAWDQPIGDHATGFRICIDDQTGAACQDIGRPDPRITSSTLPGWRTFEIALSHLTSYRAGKHRILVVAYNDGGSAESPILTVMGRSGQQTK